MVFVFIKTLTVKSPFTLVGRVERQIKHSNFAIRHVREVFIYRTRIPGNSSQHSVIIIQTCTKSITKFKRKNPSKAGGIFEYLRFLLSLWSSFTYLKKTTKKTLQSHKTLKVRCAKWNSTSKKNLHANKFKGNGIMMNSPAKGKKRPSK